MKNQYIIDTLYFVVKNLNKDGVKRLFFPYDIDWVSGGGMYGYRECVYFNGIRILFDKADNDWCYVILSGKGCRMLEDLHQLKFGVDYDWQLLLQSLSNDKVNYDVRRIDIAFDYVTKGCPSVPYLVELYLSDRVASRFSNIRYILGSEECFYFGSPQSNSMLRIYNKNLERGFKASDEEIKKLFPFGRTRFEFQFRDFEACRCVDYIALSGLSSTFNKYMCDKVRFLSKPKSFDNVSRIPNFAWYDRVFSISDIDYSISCPGSAYNREKLFNYINQCKSSVLTYYKAMNLNPKDLVDLINTASIRPDQQIFIDKENLL